MFAEGHECSSTASNRSACQCQQLTCAVSCSCGFTMLYEWFWVGSPQGCFKSRCFCTCLRQQEHLNNCTFTLLQLLLIREPRRSAAAWHSLRQRLSCLLISLSLLSVHITSFYSLLSSIFLHVTAARSLLLPDFHYTVLTLFQLHYLISASHSENQIYGIFFYFLL